MKLNKLLLGMAAVCAIASGAFAQSSPNFTYGQVPTAGQWNSYFSAKQDLLGYTPLNQAGGTMLGKLTTAASTASASGFSMYPGVAPSLPNNGDIWLTSVGLYYRAGNITFGPIGAGTITGPSTTVVGHVATWGNITGTSLIDAGLLALTAGGTGASTASGARTNLGLGTAATQNTGTSGATVPLLNTANTWSGNQSISGGSAFIDGASGTFRLWGANTSGVRRWQFGANNSAEVGSNSGTDFFINRASDAGAFIDTPMSISRATGIVTLSQPLPVASGGTGVTTSTGSGNVVLSTSPTLVTPILGAASGTSLNLSGLTASSAVATDASKNLVSVTNTGTGNNVLATSPTLVTPNLGTPSAITLTSGTGLPISTGVSGLGTGVATALATASNATGGIATTQGASTAYTPTVTFTGGTGTGSSAVSGAYQIHGKLLFFRYTATIAFTTAPSVILATLPAGFTSITGQRQIVLGSNNTQGYTIIGSLPANDTLVRSVTTTGASPVTATGDVISISGLVEVQ